MPCCTSFLQEPHPFSLSLCTHRSTLEPLCLATHAVHARLACVPASGGENLFIYERIVRMVCRSVSPDRPTNRRAETGQRDKVTAKGSYLEIRRATIPSLTLIPGDYSRYVYEKEEGTGKEGRERIGRFIRIIGTAIAILKTRVNDPPALAGVNLSVVSCSEICSSR